MESFQLHFEKSIFDHIQIPSLSFEYIPPKHLVFGLYFMYQSIHYDLQRPLIYHFKIQYDEKMEKTIMMVDIENTMYQNSIEWKEVFVFDIKWEWIEKEGVRCKGVGKEKDWRGKKGPFRKKWNQKMLEWKDVEKEIECEKRNDVL
jgi:hypothetical protein